MNSEMAEKAEEEFVVIVKGNASETINNDLQFVYVCVCLCMCSF